MAHFTPEEANAWLEATKLNVVELDNSLEEQVSVQIIARLAGTFTETVSSWQDEASTPALVRSIMAMHYCAALYDRTYSDNSDDTTSNYADILRQMANANIAGLVAGTLILAEDPTASDNASEPVFFPNDADEAWKCLNRHNRPYDGHGAAFTMGQVF